MALRRGDSCVYTMRAVTERINFHCFAKSSPQWNAEKHFTKQYYRWLEDINRYESENGAIADH
eukprot:1038138-Amphidinium_carterae.1